MTEPITELEGTWEEVRSHDAELAGRRVRLVVLSRGQTENAADPMVGRTPNARELREMPAQERSRILQEQSAYAESLYAEDPHLVDFEAFGEEDLFDETP